MFKLPALPSPQATSEELADFAEILAWKNGSVSEQELIGYLRQLDDNLDIGGIDDDDSRLQNRIEAMMVEASRRQQDCRHGYPYDLNGSGSVLTYDAEYAKRDDCTLYKYLLLSTRLNMQSNRIHGGIDGTALLEELSALILKHYLGEHSKAYVFGTSRLQGFRQRIEELCSKLQEGGGFNNKTGIPVRARDNKLDAVAWVPFKDSGPGQLILFCQCKTGTDWRDKVTELSPESFTNRWMAKNPVVKPVRVLCIAECTACNHRESIGLDAGIVIDRCRLVEYCPNFSNDLRVRLRRWVRQAIASVQL